LGAGIMPEVRLNIKDENICMDFVLASICDLLRVSQPQHPENLTQNLSYNQAKKVVIFLISVV
jgi:hypothetical protein